MNQCLGQDLAQSSLTGKPIVIGESYTLKSKILNEERQLNIYLPPGYNSKDTTRYPVVYLLDGGLDEDFLHIVGLYQFFSFPWIKTVPPTIIVGIKNTDRLRDFTFRSSQKEQNKQFPSNGGSGKFILFIRNELQPFIDSSFKTNDSKTIIGESLGGLLATEILLKKPALFNRYIIVSPSLWWDDGSLLKDSVAWANKAIYANISIYIGVGKEGLAPCKTPHVMEVDANLLVEKLKELKPAPKVYFDYLPQENHATIDHLAVFDALRALHNQ